MLFDRILSFARGIVFARLLGTTEYGIYTLGMFPIPLMATVAGLGVPSAFGRYVSRYEMRGSLGWFLRRTYLLTFGLSLVIAAAGLIRPAFFSGLLYGDPSYSLVVVVVALSIPGYLLARNLASTFMGLKLFRAGRFVESGQVAIYAGVGIALVVTSRSAAAGLLGFGLSTALSAAIFMPLLLRYVKHADRTPQTVDEPRFYRSLIRFSIWFAVTPIMGQIFQFVDRFSLQHLMSTSDQGIYSATVNLSETISAIGLAISNVIYPHLSTLWERGEKAKALQDLDLAVRITGIVLLLAGLVLVVFGKWFIVLLLGKEYLPGAAVLPYLVVFYLFTILVWLFGVYPPLIERTYVAVIGFVVAMPSTIILNLTLIPRLGMVGAALATMLSYFLMWICIVAICWKFGLPVPKRTIAVCILTLTLLLPSLAAIAAVGIVLYVCLGRTWILSAEERAKAFDEAKRIAVRLRLLVSRRG